jgi:hypothetical protein
MKELIPDVEHSTKQYANNRCELFHQPRRQQDRQMRKFKSQGQAQRFLSYLEVVNNLFRLGCHLMKEIKYRLIRDRSFVKWNGVSYVKFGIGNQTVIQFNLTVPVLVLGGQPELQWAANDRKRRLVG